MNFLKKNYEKVLLFALFVIFAVLLVHLYFIVQSTREVKEEDLEIPSRNPDYKIADVKADDFNLKKLFSINLSWSKSVSRDGNGNKDFSDLIDVFKISRCGHCQHLIPRRIMEENGNCPRCLKALLAPPKSEGGTKVAARLDSDEDGIPNVVELLFDLNPYDASDALYDLDDDGFTNLYEYRELEHSEEFQKIFSDEYKNISADEIKQMALRNPKKHPELANGLKLDKIDRQKLNASLLGVSVLTGQPKENWNIQIDIAAHPVEKLRRKRRRRLEKVGPAYKYIGDKLRLTTDEYTIHDIRKDKDAAKVVVKNKKNNTNDNKLDTSYYVILKDSKKREIIMKVGVDTYDLEHEAFFSDVWGYGKYSGKVGDTVRMGNSKIDISRYKIKSINKAKEEVVLEVPVKGVADIIIKSVAKMGKDDYVSVKDKKAEKSDSGNDQKQDAR
ncbi:MAG: hypothetical protein IKB71_01035 [Lentisphaeria bacterium]|nr:hypothetical protein [Lentisphaeria bacterium]